MLLSLPTSVRIWLALGPTDLRKGFDTLAELVRQQLRGDPLSGQLFVFRNRRGERPAVRPTWFRGDCVHVGLTPRRSPWDRLDARSCVLLLRVQSPVWARITGGR